MDESTTRELLTRVLAEAPPPAPVDLDRVVELADAYRRHRTRWVLASAAALVLVVTVAVSVLTGSSGHDALHQQPAYRPPADTSVWPRTAPTKFDPLHSSLQVGAMSASLTDRGTAFRTTNMYSYGRGRGSDGKTSLLDVAVFSKGPQPPNVELEKAHDKPIAGPTVHGNASKWYSLGELGYLLTWQWAPGAEAQVSIRGFANPLAVAAKAARSIKVNLADPTRLPFTLKSPSGFQLQEFETTTSAITSPAATVAYGSASKSFVSVNANLLGNGIGKPTTTYQGRPARVTSQFNTEGVNNTFISVQMATGDLKVTGTCNYRPNKTITLARFKTLCIATTGSVHRVADLRTPATWPEYKAQ
jgi:hypothetical protein